MAENWANGVPDEGRSPESGYRMAAEGIQFPWRGNGSAISTKLDCIWGMSTKVPRAVLFGYHQDWPEISSGECRIEVVAFGGRPYDVGSECLLSPLYHRSYPRSEEE